MDLLRRANVVVIAIAMSLLTACSVYAVGIDASVGPRSNFPMFGSVAAETPAATIVATGTAGFAFELTWVRPLEQADSEAIAQYIDAVAMAPIGAWGFGVEEFYAPSQNGLSDILFMIAIVQGNVPTSFPLVLGANLLWPAVVEDYSGDTGFIFAKSPLTRSFGAWSASLTPTLIAGNSLRFTVLGKARVGWQPLPFLGFYTSAEAAHTWDASEYSIPFTPYLGVAFTF